MLSALSDAVQVPHLIDTVALDEIGGVGELLASEKEGFCGNSHEFD